MSENEQINHPSHYGGKDNIYEVIKVIEAWGLSYSFCLGNVLKYIGRAGKKGDYLDQLKKAKWYLDREVARLEADGLSSTVDETTDVPKEVWDSISAKIGDSAGKLCVDNKSEQGEQPVVKIYRNHDYSIYCVVTPPDVRVENIPQQKCDDKMVQNAGLGAPYIDPWAVLKGE